MKKKMFSVLFLISFAYLSANEDTLVFAFDPWPPYHEIVNGKEEGVLVEIVNELFTKRLGYRIEYNQLPWARAQYQVKYGQSDFMITIPIGDRLDYTYASDIPVFVSKFVIYTYPDHPRFNEIELIGSRDDLQKAELTAVSILGYEWFETNVEPYVSGFHYAIDDSEALILLSKKRADIIIASEEPTNVHIKKLSLESLVTQTKAVYEEKEMHILLSKENAVPGLLDELNTTLKEMKEEGVIDKIMESF
jgi:polar amino acid transport system substrate-binding protein